LQSCVTARREWALGAYGTRDRPFETDGRSARGRKEFEPHSFDPGW